MRFEQREKWETKLKTAMSHGITDDELIFFIDKMVEINRVKKKPKKFAPSYAN